MSLVRLVPLVVAISVAVAACSGGQSSVDDAGAAPTLSPSGGGGPLSDPDEAGGDDEGPRDEAQAAEPEAATPVAAPGLIATTDRAGLQLRSSQGEVFAELFADDRLTQPTWSRDGTWLAATHVAVSTGAVSVLITSRDDTDAATLTAADRGYFFYSWSPAGDRIAALGPGPRGTALDILDLRGEVVSSAPIDGGSIFVAWEPDGRGLLLNVDAELRAVDDPADMTSARSLGPARVPFQAPVWLGNRKALIVTGELGPEPRLARLDVDRGELDDLGPATASTFIVASPDASAAVLVHGLDTGDGEITSASFSAQPAPAITGAVEVVDLTTGVRQRISDLPAFWAEWSPDGQAVLVGTAASTALRWDLWLGGELSTLAEFVPSQEFFDSYIRFAPAYLESPRLWSPDSAAIAFGSFVDGDSVAQTLSATPGGEPQTIGESSVAFWSPSQPRS